MFGRLKTLVLAGALLAATQATANAQVVLDQSQLINQYNLYSANTWIGQQFIPSLTNSAGAGFFFEASGRGASGILTVELWTDIASNPGASKIASGTSAFSYGASQKSWLDVFWNAVNVTPGTQYFLAFNAGGQLQDMNAYAAPGNAYANGSSLYQNYPGGADTSPYVNGYPNDDTAFREYASTAPVATPEPASMVLMATGLIGVVGIARRRRIGSNSAEV